MWWPTVMHGRGSEGETGEWSGYPVPFALPRNMVYPALLPLVRTPRLPVVDWTDAPADFNPLNAELNPICHLLTLLGAHHILHVSRVRVKWTRPFRRKTKSGFWTCAITLQTQSNWLQSVVAAVSRVFLHLPSEHQLGTIPYFPVPPEFPALKFTSHF